MRSARVVVGCVVAAAVVTMVPRLTDRQYSISSYTDADDMVTHLCFVSFETIHSLLGIDKYFFTIAIMRFFILVFSRYFFIFFWFRVIFVHLVPCSALVWLNYHLAVALRRADQRRRRLHDRWISKYLV